MSHYKLNISFSNAALDVIQAAGQKLALVKTVQGNGGNLVTWVSTYPFQSNVITWSNEYAVYATRQEQSNGAMISKLSETDASDSYVYDFGNTNRFDKISSSSVVSANQYAICNKNQKYPLLTFGLAVTALVNGEERKANPINAVTLPYNHTAVMSPIERVGIFLATDIDDGMVQTKEFSNMLMMEYKDGETELSARYDETNGIFVPA